MVLITFNVEGFYRNSFYLTQILNLAPKIVFLQEIWVPYHKESSMNKKFPSYSVQISTPDQLTPPEDRLSNPDHTWHGAAVLWHESLNSSVLQITNTNVRFTGIKLKIQSETILAISLYLPTTGKDQEFVECLAELSAYIADNTSDRVTTLIGTDSNCSERSSQYRLRAFQCFCEEQHLTKVCHTGPTFHHSNGTSSSNIDYFLISCNRGDRLKAATVQCKQDFPENLSSHDPVFSTLVIPSTTQVSQQEKYTHTYTAFSQPRVVWNTEDIPAYQALTEKFLSECDLYFPNPDFLPLKCQLYSDLLVKAAEITLDLKPCVSTAKKSQIPPRVHQAWQHLHKMYKIWKKAEKPRDSENQVFLQYKEARSAFQYIRRYTNNLKTVKENNILMQSHKADRTKHLRLIKRLRNCKPKQSITTLHTSAGDYHGKDILEGFAKDAEILGKFVGESSEFDNKFYRRCIEDNSFIFDISPEFGMKIPEMELSDLDGIIDKEMKTGKACDIYKLTAEHLKHAGYGARTAILGLVNDIIRNMKSLACPQIKAGLGTAAFKGKKKTISQASSYRRITVVPQLGSIIDRFIDPIAEKVFLPVQSADQYGFTRNISYLMGAVLRGECQRYALDTRQTCYGVSFDGQAAFPSVDREIQIRELYSSGESGDLLKYSKYTYENTVSKMKMDGKLSREISEYKGSRQGHKRAGGHFKTYINPCLITADSSQLGFRIGPVCVSVICIADDTYAVSNNPRRLQGLIDIIGHYGKRYRLIFGAGKTKVTVTGSKHDMQYYLENNIWTLYGKKLTVAENNDHLGLIVSGKDEESKNIQKNIKATRESLFGFLGNIFAYRCKLSQAVQYHTWSVFIKPVLKSRLSALPVRPHMMQPLLQFHHKILRAILKLSQYSPIPPLYFLLGELPLEATLHLDTFSLFWNIWNNPQTKVFEVIKYLLMISDSNSLTWAAHIRILFSLYKLPDPLVLLNSAPWSKQKWKSLTKIAVLSHHEALWRQKAACNFKLQYLNVQATGLTSRIHPIISQLRTTQDVALVRPHIKILAGDYLCYAFLAHDRGISPHCRLCHALAPHLAPPSEDYEHLLTRCRATADTRASRIPGLLNTIAQYSIHNTLLTEASHPKMTQFIIDCTSLNLPTDIRVPHDHPGYAPISKQCSVLINAVHKDRTRQLKSMGLLN